MIQTTGKEMQIQKKGEKKRDEREFRCEEVFTRQYLGSSTHIVIYNIQVLGGEKNTKKRETQEGVNQKTTSSSYLRRHGSFFKQTHTSSIKGVRKFCGYVFF